MVNDPSFSSNCSKMMIQKKLDRTGVFKWRLARENVIAMVDTTLSDTVPEATGYRETLLRMIEAGKTRAEEEVNQAVLQMQMAASRDIECMYIKEALVAEVKTRKIEKEIR